MGPGGGSIILCFDYGGVMKWIVLLPLFGIWLYSGNAYAVCEQLEYGELKDMSQKEMTEIYCRLNREHLQLIKYNTNMIKINGRTKDIEENQCHEVTYKMERTWKRRFPDSGNIRDKCEEIKK
jgi:hypothetical protein